MSALFKHEICEVTTQAYLCTPNTPHNMDEKVMLIDLRQHMQKRLELLEQQIILSEPDDDDDEFAFLLKKAANFRDTIQKIDQRLKEL